MILADLKNERLGICVSGGLDSRTITRRFKDEGIDCVCFTADLAQPDEKDIKDVVKRMAPCGVKTIIVDLKDEMAEACLEMIKAQAMYDGGYWNTTGIARAVTTRGLLPVMKKHGCTVLVHGATGRGNDQMRFERYTNVLDPRMKVYAPWRDAELLKEFPGRKQMSDYLNSKGIVAFAGGKKRYSTDANLAGLSHEAEDLESVETPCLIVEPKMGVWPSDAPDKMEKVTVDFVRGKAIAVNGKKMSPLKLMQTANRTAGRNGIGLKNALENRIIGTKSRGVYEAPGMEMLGYCLRQVYFAVLEKRASELFFNTLSPLIARQVYDGRLFDPVTRAAMSAIDTLAEYASGTVSIGLYKGNMHFLSLKNCRASLYNEADSSMEESKGLNPQSSQGYAEIQSVEAKSLAKARQIRS